jgi:hypothetical protein
MDETKGVSKASLWCNEEFVKVNDSISDSIGNKSEVPDDILSTKSFSIVVFDMLLEGHTGFSGN